MEMEDQLAEKAFRDNEARKLVDADGYHMVNCQCDDCLYVEDKLASDNTQKGGYMSILGSIKPQIDKAVQELVYGKPKKPKAIAVKAIKVIAQTDNKGE